MYRSYLITVDASVVQTARTANVAIVTDTHILDRTGVEYHDMITDRTDSRSMLIGIEICYFLHPCNQLRTMAVKRHDISLMSGKFITDKNLTATRFVQNGYLYTITKFR